MCDNIIFIGNGELLIVVVELKGKSPDATKIGSQLQQGYRIAEKLLAACNPHKLDPEFAFVAVARQWKSTEHRSIRARRMRCRGSKLPIRTGRSGDLLTKLLKRRTN